PTGRAASATTRIGLADVEAIEQATAVFRQSDFSQGGGVCRPMAVAKLRSVLALHHAACDSAVRGRLMVATADLGMVAAWASYDAERHNDARRLWMIALSVARQADHPRATDLTADLLLDMAHQALHLRRPHEALSLVQLGYGVAASRTHPVSACTASYLASNQAWCHAAQGDAQACDRALGQAIEHFSQADPARLRRGPPTSTPPNWPPNRVTPTTPWLWRQLMGNTQPGPCPCSARQSTGTGRLTPAPARSTSPVWPEHRRLPEISTPPRAPVTTRSKRSPR